MSCWHSMWSTKHCTVSSVSFHIDLNISISKYLESAKPQGIAWSQQFQLRPCMTTCHAPCPSEAEFPKKFASMSLDLWHSKDQVLSHGPSIASWSWDHKTCWMRVEVWFESVGTELHGKHACTVIWRMYWTCILVGIQYAHVWFDINAVSKKNCSDMLFPFVTRLRRYLVSSSRIQNAKKHRAA